MSDLSKAGRRLASLIRGFVGIAVMLAGQQCAAALTFYVAPEGDDSLSGTSSVRKGVDGPLLTVERARDVIRDIKARGDLPKGGITVEIQSGTYRLKRPLEFTAADGGTKDSPIVYRAAAGVSPRIVGSVVVPDFTGVHDSGIRARLDPGARSMVLSARIVELTDNQQMGTSLLRRDSSSAGALPATTQLFFRGRPMPFARWPNDSYLTVAALVDGGQRKFVFEGEHRRNWDSETDIWAHGYWYWDWADQWLPIARVDSDHNTAEFSGAVSSHYGVRAGQRFYFINVLAELDSPGEWFLDRTTGTVYFWPPKALMQGDVELSVLDKLLSVDNANYLDFSGLVFEMSRGNGIEVRGAKGVHIRDSIIRNVQGYAVRFDNCTDGGISGSLIQETGDGGIALIGGDRSKLTPGKLVAKDNHISHFSRLNRTMRPAIWLGGVGNRVAHNHIHHGPHVGIYFEGNDHVIEFNEIDHVAQETDDVGALYIGRDWTSRGNILRNNYIHDVTGRKIGAMGVYLDDQASGVLVEHNVIARVQHPVLIGGGRDNHVIGNVFVGTGNAVLVDNRGMGYQKGLWSDENGEIRKKLDAVPWNREPYLSQYPDLSKVFVDHPGAPVGTVIRKNIAFGQTVEAVADIIKPFVDIGKNYIISDNQANHFAEAMDRFGLAALGHPGLFGGTPEIKGIIARVRATEIGPRCGNTTKACRAVE